MYLDEDDDEGLFSTDGLNDLPDWEADRMFSFAEWLGYQIAENPKSQSGYSVIGPDGQHLSGFVAASIISAWQKNPSGEKAKKPSKAGGKKAAGPTPEEKKAAAAEKKAATAVQKTADAKTAAANTLKGVLPDVLDAKSKGKVVGATVQGMMDSASKAIADAKDDKEVKQILASFKQNLATYKAEATKPPPVSQQLRSTLTKITSNLPNATTLAGTSYNAKPIQGIVDTYTARINASSTPDQAKLLVSQMKSSIAAEKVSQAKAKAAAKVSGKQPRTASEWAEWYSSAYADAG